jgi:hypothetical protein
MRGGNLTFLCLKLNLIYFILSDFSSFSFFLFFFFLFSKAKPVIKGRKFAANSWLHLYDFAKPNLWGCTGTFDDL